MFLFIIPSAAQCPKVLGTQQEAQQTLTELMIALNTEGTLKNFLQFGYQAYICVH